MKAYNITKLTAELKSNSVQYRNKIQRRLCCRKMSVRPSVCLSVTRL